MKLFSKNKNSNLTPPPTIIKECNHKYQDFPWYIESMYYTDTHNWEAKIKEPYVCIYCGKRDDKILETKRRINVTRDQADKYFNDLYDQYKDYVKPRAVIEDMINDMVLVDQEYLKWYRILRNQENSHPQIKLQL